MPMELYLAIFQNTVFCNISNFVNHFILVQNSNQPRSSELAQPSTQPCPQPCPQLSPQPSPQPSPKHSPQPSTAQLSRTESSPAQPSILYFLKIRYFIFLQNSAFCSGKNSSQPASQSRQAAALAWIFFILQNSVFYIFTKCRSTGGGLAIFYFYKIPYFTFLQNTAPPASGPGTTADPAQPSQLASKHS